MGELPDTTDLGLLDRDAVRLDVNAAPLAGREVIVATGADRVRFLHGLVTGKIAGTPVGGGARAALLTTKGQVISDLHVFVRPDDMRIVVAGGQAEPTAAALARYAIMDDFTAVAAPELKLTGLLGPRAAGRLEEVGVAPGALAGAAPLSHAEVTGAGHTFWLVRVRELGRDGFWIGGAPAALGALGERLAAAGVPSLSPAVAAAARVQALEPQWGSEITGDYFPMEVGLSQAIDYTKGCYLGQEPIVRIRDRGHINWRLVGLDVEGAADPSPQDRLETEAKPKAGRITSAARLPDGRAVALALLHTSIPVGAAVRIHHEDAVISAVVRADAP